MKRLLFVCMGNICRSPLAEGIVRADPRAAALGLTLDSAGTSAYHAGEAPDPRARGVARRFGTPIDDLRARQVRADDFERFDLILAADRQNLSALARIAPPARADRAVLLLDWCGERPGGEVPDPYYGGEDDFDAVYRLLQSASARLFARLGD